MVPFFLTLIIVAFFGLLFINLYFRAKVLKVYRRLANSGTSIKAVHIFDKKKLEEEVLIHHPEYKDDILTFVNNIRYSVRLASGLILLITLFTAILMFFGDN
ncbi:MAG: hypothetical protein AAF502_05190 [Bacteroidota bacterium]